jgi:hypothetical protein
MNELTVKDKIIQEVVYQLKRNVEELGDFVLRPGLPDSISRFGLGIEYRNLKNLWNLEECITSFSLLKAEKEGLISIRNNFSKGNILNNDAVIQLTSKDFSILKNKLKTKYQRIM